MEILKRHLNLSCISGTNSSKRPAAKTAGHQCNRKQYRGPGTRLNGMVPSHTSIVRLAKPQCVFGTCTTIGQSVDDDIDGLSLASYLEASNIFQDLTTLVLDFQSIPPSIQCTN
ncbi:hypothetical protein GQX74_009478 [Glossina fuscipes]|nr:hypothetical protein GQX74_009478 [Glossina fuscipes]